MWTEAEIDRLEVLRAEGKSFAECGVLLGKTRGQVSGLVDRSRMIGRHITAPHAWTGADEMTLRRLTDEGFTQSEIASTMNRTRESIGAKQNRMGLKSRSGDHGRQRGKKPGASFWSAENTEIARVRWYAGVPSAAIAREIGTTERSINRKRERMGWHDRGHGGGREVPVRKPRGFTVKPTLKTADRPKPIPVIDDVPVSSGVLLIDLGAHCCRWPIYAAPRGMGENTRFCGERAEWNYCAGHRRMAFRVAA